MDEKKSKLSGFLDKTKGAAASVKNGVLKAKDKGTDVAVKSKEEIIKALDENGDGVVDLEDIIIKGVKTPGVAIERDVFLRKELAKYCPEDVIEKAVAETPMKAGVSGEIVEKIAKAVIQYERNCVSGISAALSMPGGVAMVATIPADIIQYYGYMLRATQKLLYLYGFPDLKVPERGTVCDSETMNVLILCFGVMNKVAGAREAIRQVSNMLAKGVYKELQKKALTKGVVYPIVKKVSKWFGVKMTKEVFAGFFKKAIPVIGGVIGGSLTYAAFGPCCNRLKASLEDTILSNPDYVDEAKEDIIIDAEEVEEEDVIDPDDVVEDVSEEEAK